MIRVHKANNNVPMLIEESQFTFIPTEDNGTAMLDCLATDISDYFEDNEVDVVYLQESLEDIESLIRVSKCN